MSRAERPQGRVGGLLFKAKSARSNPVQARLRAEAGRVDVDLHVDNRRRAEGDVRLVLTPAAARELMRLLQGRADEADRLAYQAAKRAPIDELDAAVRAVARRLSTGESADGASTPHAGAET